MKLWGNIKKKNYNLTTIALFFIQPYRYIATQILIIMY